VTADELQRKLLDAAGRMLNLSPWVLHGDDRRLMLTMRDFIATADAATKDKLLSHYPSE